MSTQAELNSNPYAYFLYYAYQNDPVTIFQTDLSDIALLYFDINSDIQISSWIASGFGPPTMPITLLAYLLSDVLSFVNNFYTIPQNILLAQPYTLTTTQLNAVIPHSNMLGFLVFDSTVHALKFWNGSSWIPSGSLFLKLDGSVNMTGDLNLGTHNIVNIGNITQSSPSCIGIYTSASTAISFTANTPKVVSLASFSQSINPNSDFSFNSSTGECKYTGTPTKYFRVSVNFSCTALAVASTQTNYISKNGSTSISAQRSVNSYLLLGQTNIDSYSLSDVIQLATNDTIQLGSQLSTTNNVTFSNISYAISQI